MKTPLPALAAFLTLSACDGDSSAPAARDVTTSRDATILDGAGASDATSGTRTDTAAAGDTASGAADTGASGSCDRSGWVPEGLVQATAYRNDDGQLGLSVFESYLQNPTSDTDPLDALLLELYYDLGVETGPLTFTFAGENYVDCAICALIYLGCDADGSCQSVWLAQSGTLELSANGGESGRLTGTLRDVRFAEVTINEDYESTPVIPGQTWCIDRYDFDTGITLDPGTP